LITKEDTMTSQVHAFHPAAVANPRVGEGFMGQFAVTMAFARGEEIYAQEEDADLIYQVVSGAVRTTRLMSDGRRQIGAFHYPGDVFGMEQGDVHRFAAEALGDCIILVARKRTMALAAGQDAYDRFVSSALLAELNRAQDHLILLGRKTACERVASFLLDVANRSPGALIDLPMGRQDMADYLGLTIETVSRMVTQLQVSGVVDFPCCRQFLIRNRAALERFSD
jgi:CRP/FNR family nitrogen fixation transcriptional regulator